MLVHLDTRTQEEWLLSFINACLRDKDIPTQNKRFNVWCIEKKQGVGPIMHPSSKLQVRPISLFEVSLKLVEVVIASRLHSSQHGFLPHRSVTDALRTYTLLMEDAHDHKREIQISNNDCTQAYDAVPPWAMRASIAITASHHTSWICSATWTPTGWAAFSLPMGLETNGP
jgi:hypothetical protein